MAKVDLSSIAVALLFTFASAAGTFVLVRWIGFPGWASGLCGLVFGGLTVAFLLLMISRQT